MVCRGAALLTRLTRLTATQAYSPRSCNLREMGSVRTSRCEISSVISEISLSQFPRLLTTGPHCPLF